MKIFPIKVENVNSVNYKFIEWQIHNVCNHDCSFCSKHYKDGSVRWFELEKYKSYVDKLIEMCHGQPVWIQLTGGEPTLYPDLLELIVYIKSKGAMVSILSNGTRTLRWWKELQETDALDYLVLTYHPDQTNDWQHISNVVNLFHNKSIEVIVLITHTINSLNKAIADMNNLVDTTGALLCLRGMKIDNIYETYTADQLEKVKNTNWQVGKNRKTKQKPSTDSKFDLSKVLRVTYNNNLDDIVVPQLLIKNKKNTFLGWDCFIGKDSMRIDSETVYRGVCAQGPKRRIDDPNLSFTDDSIKCGLEECHCTMDLIATKILPEGMYPQA